MILIGISKWAVNFSSIVLDSLCSLYLPYQHNFQWKILKSNLDISISLTDSHGGHLGNFKISDVCAFFLIKKEKKQINQN